MSSPRAGAFAEGTAGRPKQGADKSTRRHVQSHASRLKRVCDMLIAGHG